MIHEVHYYYVYATEINSEVFSLMEDVFNFEWDSEYTSFEIPKPSDYDDEDKKELAEVVRADFFGLGYDPEKHGDSMRVYYDW